MDQRHDEESNLIRAIPSGRWSLTGRHQHQNWKQTPVDSARGGGADSLPDKVEQDQTTNAEVSADVINAASGIYRLVRINHNNGCTVNDKAEETAT